MNTLLVNSLHWIKHVGFIFHSRSVVNDVKPTSTCTATCIRNSSLLNRLGGRDDTGVEEGSKSDLLQGWKKEKETGRDRGPSHRRDSQIVYQTIANCTMITDGVLAILSLCPGCPVIAASTGSLSGTLMPVCVPVEQDASSRCWQKGEISVWMSYENEHCRYYRMKSLSINKVT